MSCALFNIFINEICGELEFLDGPIIHKSLYVDDLAIWVNGFHPKEIAHQLQRGIGLIETFCENNNMKISVEKTVSTWFSRATKRTKSPLPLTVSGKICRRSEIPWNNARQASEPEQTL